MITGCYLLFLTLLPETRGICRDTARKNPPHITLDMLSGPNTQHWALSWAVGAGVLLLDERCLLTPSEELKFEVQGHVLSFIYFYSWEIHMCMFMCIYKECERKKEEGEAREWKLSYLLFLLYFLQQKLLLSPFLAAAVWPLQCLR